MNDVLLFRLARLKRLGLVVGLISLAVSASGLVFQPRQFFISYLVAYSFWLGLSLGCLGVAMIHYLTGGRWGFVTQRLLEAGFMTLPLMALFFIPLIFGLSKLYPWAQHGIPVPPLTAGVEAHYLNRAGFFARTVCFIAIWLVMAAYLRRWSLQQEASTDPASTIRLRALSGPGIVIYPLTATFAFVDWVMSIEPEWYSTIFPLTVLAGQVLLAYAFVTLLLAWFREQPPFRDVVNRTHFHDLGNLLLTFVIFWTYVSFAQLLIIYSGNLPHEIDWYLHRIAGGWKWVIGIIALLHFFIPFFLLLFRVMKQNIRRLAVIAALLFCIHAVEVYWTIEPTFFSGVHVHWLDFTTLLGLGGIWLAVFSANLKRHSLLPINDPRIEYSISQLANAN